MHAVANDPDATGPTTKPTIILPAGVRPARACSSDTTRPMLCHAYLREREDGWWLLATDAYIAAAIKVEAKGDVVEGYVPFGALSDMRYGGLANEQVSATAWAVLTERGRIVYEIPEPVVSSAKPYPDFNVLGMWEGEPAEPVAVIGMNPRFARRLALALGIARHDGCRFEMRKAPGIARPPQSPDLPAMMRVTGGYRYPDRIGLLMSVRLSEC